MNDLQPPQEDTGQLDVDAEKRLHDLLRTALKNQRNRPVAPPRMLSEPYLRLWYTNGVFIEGFLVTPIEHVRSYEHVRFVQGGTTKEILIRLGDFTVIEPG